MKIMERITLLIRADAHGVMDQMEEQALLLKQHLRDAELELGHKRARVADVEVRERELGDRVAALERELSALDADVELALAGDEEELARFAVRQLIPRRAARDRLSHKASVLREERVRIGERLGAQELQFERMKTDVRARLASLEQSERLRGESGPEAAIVADPAGGVADEEVELELLRRRSVRDDAEGGV